MPSGWRQEMLLLALDEAFVPDLVPIGEYSYSDAFQHHLRRTPYRKLERSVERRSKRLAARRSTSWIDVLDSWLALLERPISSLDASLQINKKEFLAAFLPFVSQWEKHMGETHGRNIVLVFAVCILQLGYSVYFSSLTNLTRNEES
jgi:hypothetical protein